MEEEDLTMPDVFRVKCHGQRRPHSKLVKGWPFSEHSETLAPRELFQTSFPTMIPCCELFCHVNLMLQNVNRLHLLKTRVYW